MTIFQEAYNHTSGTFAYLLIRTLYSMQLKPFSLRSFIALISSLLLLQSLMGCDIEYDNNIPNVPPEGRFIIVTANQHSGVSDVQVAVALLEDAQPINLVGGDIVQASTVDDSILLLEKGVYNGSYAASLPNALNFNQVDFLIVHKPIEARQGRWYPVDLLYTDPGPGEFVGASASVTLPPEPLNLSTSQSTFSNINESFTLNWVAESGNETMVIRSVVSCSDGSTTYNYGTVAALNDSSDDGEQIVGLDQFIYDTNDLKPPPFEFILRESRAALQELLSWLEEIGKDDEFFNNFTIINPIENNCEIRLFLFREKEGEFDDSSVNRRIYASRSAEITLQYTPLVLMVQP